VGVIPIDIELLEIELRELQEAKTSEDVDAKLNEIDSFIGIMKLYTVTTSMIRRRRDPRSKGWWRQPSTQLSGESR
jgi:hypothetical protein